MLENPLLVLHKYDFDCVEEPCTSMWESWLFAYNSTCLWNITVIERWESDYVLYTLVYKVTIHFGVTRKPLCNTYYTPWAIICLKRRWRCKISEVMAAKPISTVFYVSTHTSTNITVLTVILPQHFTCKNDVVPLVFRPRSIAFENSRIFANKW